MGKRYEVEVDGKVYYYRMRRGKMVLIPPEWAGKTIHPQSIRKRPSKQIRKRRKEINSTFPQSKERTEEGIRSNEGRE